MHSVARDLSVGILASILASFVVIAVTGPRPDRTGWTILIAVAILVFIFTLLGSKHYFGQPKTSGVPGVTIAENIRGRDIAVSDIKVNSSDHGSTRIGNHITGRDVSITGVSVESPDEREVESNGEHR